MKETFRGLAVSSYIIAFGVWLIGIPYEVAKWDWVFFASMGAICAILYAGTKESQ